MLIGLSIFFLLWFIAALRRNVSVGDPDGLLTSIVGLGGGVYAAVALVAVGLEAGIKTMSDDTYHHQVYPELIHAADDAGWVIHASGGAGLGAMIIAASLAGLRAGAIPRWAGWLSVVVGIISLFLIVFFPWFVVAIWILIVSIGMFIRAGRASAAAPA